MTRIAIVAPYYPPSVGGVQAYAARVAELIADRTPASATPVLVITTGSGRWRAQTEATDRMVIVRLPVLLNWSNTPLHPIWPLLVWWLLRRHRIDLVLTHAPVVGLADVARLVLGRRRLIATHHSGSMAKGESALLDRVLRTYERWVLPWVFRRAERVVAVSPVALGADLPQSVIIPPGFDPHLFRRDPEVPREARTVCYVGRLDTTSRWKGVDRLIAAVAWLREQEIDLRLELVGPGDAVPELAALADRAGLGRRVAFPGPRHGPELADTYRRATVTVLPSLTAAESFGMTLVEAMACGSAVIGTRGTGAAYVIEDGRTGLLVPPDDVPALAAAIGQLLADPAERSTLTDRAADEVVARFSWDTALAQWAELLDLKQREKVP